MIKIQKLNVVREIDERHWPEYEKNGYVRVDNPVQVYTPKKTTTKEMSE